MKPSFFAFDMEVASRATAVAIAREHSEDGMGRFVFSFEGSWYISRIMPPAETIKYVECIIPEDAHWSRAAQYQA